jgi:hypothetical protein
MAAAVATPHEEREGSAGALHYGQRVWTPEGDAGRIAGFYRTETPTVLVRRDSGEDRQFTAAALLIA